MFQPEFQAVVLAAGRGSRMPEITSGKPKCLLPVGTKPLVWYPLYKLQQSGFTDVILVVLENHKSEIQATLDKSELEIKIDYFPVSGKEDLGTADSLRLLHDRLKSDVLVISCDFITDFSLKGVLDVFRMHDASVASLFFHPHGGELTIPGPKSKHKPERDLVGIDAQTNRLVFLASASDFESELSLPRSLLKKHTHVKMYSNLVDSHVYVLKNWVVKYLNSQPNFTTIKGELLPHIVKKQLSKPPKGAEGKSIVSKCDSEDIFNYAKEDPFSIIIRESSSYNDHIGDSKPTYHGDSIRCYALIAPRDSFGVRVNTLATYWAVNSKVSERWDKITNGLSLVLRHPKSEIKSSQVDDKCVVWEGAKLHEKTSFKNSVIGANSEVCSFSRVFNCIVMNNVTIKEKVALENCIVSDGVTIEKGCQIKGCLIGSHHLVPENSEHSQEVLTDSDRLMEF
ncbi:translation initiation factor eIF2B subunit gamma [Tribolium castaneum]|uniref:Translation initiation factor eIF2B subunit gamma n=1 Tax=Tribolium castaneum TaxID=7070 RepID=D6X364_TRICA|nr:PREDICTED: translation initiation factor eIF-2B subunit gamma [Tribolium castaneum]EFA10335.1 Translation initiation factor eIF-2B subunit gamma-like Protein [Tribolium castaneum]|eukprot:XP_971487.1 PREDICTED: translation initiation factor eIF-2B subunit gamma [Tribolium castaneum]